MVSRFLRRTSKVAKWCLIVDDLVTFQSIRIPSRASVILNAVSSSRSELHPDSSQTLPLMLPRTDQIMKGSSSGSTLSLDGAACKRRSPTWRLILEKCTASKPSWLRWDQIKISLYLCIYETVWNWISHFIEIEIKIKMKFWSINVKCLIFRL